MRCFCSVPDSQLGLRHICKHGSLCGRAPSRAATAAPPAHAGQQGLLACVGVVRHQQIAAGVMLPVLLSGRLSARHADAQVQAAPAAGWQWQQHWRGAASAAAALRLVTARVAAAWAWLDCCLAEGCCLLLEDPLNVVAACWVLSAIAWMLARTAAEAALQRG